MTEENELMLELAKNKADKLIVQKELEREKNNFINEIMSGIGNEMKDIQNINSFNTPIKIKVPFKVKLHKFKIKLMKILGLYNGT